MITGYPNLAAFADSDESFMVYRRFGYLQSRLLLEKQNDLRRLEEELDRLDAVEIYMAAPENVFTRQWQGSQRKEILKSIEARFCEYSMMNFLEVEVC